MPAAVIAAERATVEREGRHHVGGVYYASARDAAERRRWSAERTVREEARREASSAEQSAP